MLNVLQRVDAIDGLLGLVSIHVVLVSWVACGATISSVHKLLVSPKRAKETKPASHVFESVILFAYRTTFDTMAALLEVTMGIFRTIFGYLPLLGFLFLTVSSSYLLLSFNKEIVFTVDTFYESVRPTIIESIFQVINFIRVLFAICIGFWNAIIDIALVPVRLIFDAGFACGGTKFVQALSETGSVVVREGSTALVGFFNTLQDKNELDIDVTLFSASVRAFLATFTDVVECSCDIQYKTSSLNITGTIAYVLFTQETDILASSIARTALKVVDIPYSVVTSGSASFEPLLDCILDEDTGFLHAMSKLANSQLEAVINLVQTEIPEEFHFKSPPIFSLYHRLAAIMVFEPIRSAIRLASVLPVLIDPRSESSEIADAVHKSSSIRPWCFHLEAYVNTFVEIGSSLNEYFRPYAELFAATSLLSIRSYEIAYNSTVTGTVGSASWDYRDGAPFCALQVQHTRNILDRARYSIVHYGSLYDLKLVPLQKEMALKVRNVIVTKFFQVAVAESYYAFLLTSISFFQGYVQLGAYVTDAILRGKKVSHTCISRFLQPKHELYMDTLTSLPNLLTSIMDFSDTTDSGYANLVCARTTHVNHIYSGSLKAYVLASSACDATFESGEVPKCSYRHVDIDVQNAMCSKLIAFGDYNTNPLCNGGDYIIQIFKGAYISFRTLEEYQIGITVSIWNCMTRIGSEEVTKTFVECASSITKELIPPKLVFDLVECQTAEMLYRISMLAVSATTPIFQAIYSLLDYPDDGYVVENNNALHVQAKPLEAALTTFITAAMGLPFWILHTQAYLGREVIDIIQNLQTGDIQDALPKIFQIRYTAQIAVVRMFVLYYRDALIAALEFGRASATLAEYNRQRLDSSITSPNPRLPHADFTVFQDAVRTIVGLAQDFVEIVGEAFFKGVEALFECIFLLIKALLAESGNQELFREFFSTFFNKLGNLAMDFINEMVSLLFAPGTPLNYLCQAVQAIKKGFCSVITSEWVPTGLAIKCGADKSKCSWWPFANGELNFVKNVGAQQSTVNLDMSDTAVDFNRKYDMISLVELLRTRPYLYLASQSSNDGLCSAFSNDACARQCISSWKIVRGFMETNSGSTCSCPRTDGLDPKGSIIIQNAEFFYEISIEGSDMINLYVYNGRITAVGCTYTYSTSASASGRRLLEDTEDEDEFQFSLAEYDPERRRHLLGGAKALDPREWTKQLVKAVTDPIVKTVNLIGKEVVDPMIKPINDAAKAVKKAVNDVKNNAIDLANKVAKMPEFIWDKIYSIVPTYFDPKVSSIGQLMMGSNERARADLSCGEDMCSMKKLTNECGQSQEATVCSTDQECKHSAFCVTADQDLCGGGESPLTDPVCVRGSEWAKSCMCGTLLIGAIGDNDMSKKSHCNFATGFCTAGATPFTAPLKTCSDAASLVYGSAGYNSLCYISPLWMCATAPNKTECRSLLWDKKQGPSLCRAFCDPTFENRNNRLADYEYNGETACVCEVGVDRVFPNDVGASSVGQVQMIPATGRKRALLASPNAPNEDEQSEPDSSSYTTSPYSYCSTHGECSPSFSKPTICRSLWDTATTCYSCSERVHGPQNPSLGYECNSATKTCDCSPPNILFTEDDRERPDDTEWRGDSWCDEIMRGYRYAAIRSPLEKAWVHRCSSLRAFSVNMLNWVGLQSMPNDILYNPRRIISVVLDVVEGVYTYFSEGWSDDEQSNEAFFTRLVDKRIDPILTFKALSACQKIMGISYGIISEIDLTGSVQSVLETLHPEAAGKFEEAVNSTRHAFDGVGKSLQSNDKNMASVISAFGSSATSFVSLANVIWNSNISMSSSIISVNASSNTVVQYNASLGINDSDDFDDFDDPDVSDVSDEVGFFAAPRHLLVSFEKCLIVTNLKQRVVAIGSQLTEYYGTKDAFIAASLCAYEEFLMHESHESCKTIKGQSRFAAGANLSSGLPAMTFLKSLSPLALKKSTDDWFNKTQDEMVDHILELTADWELPATCSETILCKKQTRSLLTSMVITEMWITVGMAGVLLFGINLLSASVFITAQFVVAPPMVLYLTYEFPITCFPRLPVCIADDLFDLMIYVLPMHIRWPKYIVQNASHVDVPFPSWFKKLKADRVVDCKDFGFKGIYDVFFWARFQGYEENTTENVFEWTWRSVEWPLVRFLPGARSSRARWQTDPSSQEQDQCAFLNAPSLFPPIIVSFFFYVAFSFAIVPLLRNFERVVVRTSPIVRSSIALLIDIYKG
jgi:hypothetical protein